MYGYMEIAKKLTSQIRRRNSCESGVFGETVKDRGLMVDDENRDFNGCSGDITNLAPRFFGVASLEY